MFCYVNLFQVILKFENVKLKKKFNVIKYVLIQNSWERIKKNVKTTFLNFILFFDLFEENSKISVQWPNL